MCERSAACPAIRAIDAGTKTSSSSGTKGSSSARLVLGDPIMFLEETSEPLLVEARLRLSVLIYRQSAHNLDDESGEGQREHLGVAFSIGCGRQKVASTALTRQLLGRSIAVRVLENKGTMEFIQTAMMMTKARRTKRTYGSGGTAGTKAMQGRIDLQWMNVQKMTMKRTGQIQSQLFEVSFHMDHQASRLWCRRVTASGPNRSRIGRRRGARITLMQGRNPCL